MSVIAGILRKVAAVSLASTIFGLVSGSIALAQDDKELLKLSPVPLVEKELELPWFERFEHPGGVSRLSQTQQFSLSDEINLWSPGEKFNMSVEILGNSYLIDPESVKLDGFAARAKYNLSPSLSIGGSVELSDELPLATDGFQSPREEEKKAQIKIESAIRF